MSENNGWPGPPGVPLNPEREGRHWIHRKDWNKPRPAAWWPSRNSPIGGWWDGWIIVRPDEIADMTYAGPCLTPAEVEARIATARKDALEEAARVVEAVKTWGGHYDYCESCKGGAVYPDSEEVAADIRALKGEK